MRRPLPCQGNHYSESGEDVNPGPVPTVEHTGDHTGGTEHIRAGRPGSRSVASGPMEGYFAPARA